MQLRVQSACLCQLESRVHRTGRLPIDESSRKASDRYDVPRASVTMTYDSGRASQAPSEPGLPDRFHWNDERGRSFVQPSQHCADDRQRFIRPWARMDEVTFDKSKRLAALIIEAGAHNSRGIGETDMLEVSQQSDDR